VYGRFRLYAPAGQLLDNGRSTCYNCARRVLIDGRRCQVGLFWSIDNDKKVVVLSLGSSSLVIGSTTIAFVTFTKDPTFSMAPDGSWGCGRWSDIELCLAKSYH
jgi:hypothetical protein